MALTNNSWSIFDLFRGSGERQGSTEQFGFIFSETSGRTKSGENVNVDNALEDATVVSCINAIVDGITQIPIYIHKRRPDGKGSERIVNHKIEKLLRRPNKFQTATDFKSSIVTSILIYGNAYIRIIREGGFNTTVPNGSR